MKLLFPRNVGWIRGAKWESFVRSDPIYFGIPDSSTNRKTTVLYTRQDQIYCMFRAGERLVHNYLWVS